MPHYKVHAYVADILRVKRHSAGSKEGRLFLQATKRVQYDFFKMVTMQLLHLYKSLSCEHYNYFQSLVDITPFKLSNKICCLVMLDIPHLQLLISLLLTPPLSF